MTDLVNTIKQMHANLNKDLAIIGLLRVMFDPSSKGAQAFTAFAVEMVQRIKKA